MRHIRDFWLCPSPFFIYIYFHIFGATALELTSEPNLLPSFEAQPSLLLTREDCSPPINHESLLQHSSL